MLKRYLLPVVMVVLCGSAYFIMFKYRPYRDKQLAKTELANLVKTNSLQNFDIIFQTSHSAQSVAIQLATHSPYSHCGIVYWRNGKCFVWEACNGVTETSVEEFIARGEGAHFVLKRLKNGSLLNKTAAGRIEGVFKEYKGRPYDLYFGWSDDKLYCSELVWKLYKKGFDIELGTTQQLQDFDLSNPVVKLKLRQRYGSILPLTETVISPADIFHSNKLVTVTEM